MKKTFAIFIKELKSFFYSPMAYVVIGLFTALTGYFFYSILSWFVEQSFIATMQAQQYAQYGQKPPTFNVNLQVIRGYFGTLAFLSLIILPLITMRLFSEEKKQGTVELLFTSPISSLNIILGKYFAGLAFYFVLLIPTILFQSLLFAYGNPELLPVISGYIGLMFLGSAFVSVGLFISTMTENQIIAAIGGFALSLFLWVIGFGANIAGPTLAPLLEYISILNHFEDFAQGVIDSSHIAYYVLFSFMGVYLSLKSVESLKWRA
jgi:gliding motility-associated transport system permease protein